MRRIATVLLALATATIAAGCGGHGDRERAQFVPDAGQFHVPAGTTVLPEGHPPIDRYGHGLPPGHPVCPAGRHLFERGVEGPGGAGGGTPQVISI